MHQYSETTGKNAWEYTQQVDWHRVSNQYRDFLKSVREDAKVLASAVVAPIEQSPFREYDQVVVYIDKTINRLDRINAGTLNRIVDRYISAIGKWNNIVSEMKGKESSWLAKR